MRRHWPIALLIVAALAFAATGAVVQQAVTARYELTRDDSRRCGAMTLKGTPCRNPVKRAGLRCWRHRLIAPRTVAIDRT